MSRRWQRRWLALSAREVPVTERLQDAFSETSGGSSFSMILLSNQSGMKYSPSFKAAFRC
ncbi:MAG: hypothetical protein HC839_01300 [Leptolyngbyaceae cyanobacterium RM2_2_21]|nr:hypothetical protein [Leptolyngbyaceae cyanobacterium RM2_2_21]